MAAPVSTLKLSSSQRNVEIDALADDGLDILRLLVLKIKLVLGKKSILDAKVTQVVVHLTPLRAANWRSGNLSSLQVLEAVYVVCNLRP